MGPHARVTSADNDPLEAAVRQQDVARVEELIKQGYVVEHRSWLDDTILHRAAKGGNAAIVKLLLSARGKEYLDSFYLGWTPLIVAAIYGHAEVVRVLIAAGSSIDIKDDDGLANTALHEAVQSGHLETVVVLLNAGANPNIRGSLQWSAIDQAQIEAKSGIYDARYDILRLVEKAGEHFAYVAVKRGIPEPEIPE